MRFGGRLGRMALPTVAVAVLAGGLAIPALRSPDLASSAQTAACRPISGPFHTRGAKVFNAEQRRYIPYGISVVGLAHPSNDATVEADKRQIEAAATSWCSNTIRLQISQDRLIDGRGHRAADLSINRAFFAKVKEEVSYARSLGLVVVINLQTQNDVDFRDVEYMPTQRSLRFWRAMVGAYGRDRSVIFDLFNEPGQVGTWDRWRNGFKRNGVRYFGMQEVAKRIRNLGAKNLLWIQGTQHGVLLTQAWKYRLARVGPLMYAEHRPPQPNTTATWRDTFGYLAERNLAPVVVGEWAQYARSDAPWACWDNAPVEVPRWLNYLEQNNVGMIASKLSPWQLIQSSDLADPTVFRSDWQCIDGLNQGAGTLIMAWFHKRNA